MRSFGIIKYGRSGKADKSLDFIDEDEKPYSSYIDYKSFDDLSDVNDNEYQNEFDNMNKQDESLIDDSISFSGVQSAISIDNDRLIKYKSFHKQVKHTMKLLNFASLEASKEKDTMKALISLQKTVNASYYSRSKLGSLGVCNILVCLVRRYQNVRDLVIEIFKSICDLLNLETKNKITISKCGLINELKSIYNIYKDDSEVLEQFCKVVIELMNSKFHEMLEINKKKDETKLLATSQYETNSNSNSHIGTNHHDGYKSDYKDQQQKYEDTAHSNMLTAMTTAATMTIYEDDEPAESKDNFPTLWDNCKELYTIGICDILMDILDRLKPTIIRKVFVSSSNNSITSLDSIFEEENVILATCSAIASLAYNHECAIIFGDNFIFAQNISSLLIISHNSMYHDDSDWELRIAAVWVIINLCTDNKTNNRKNFGKARVCEHLMKGLTDYVYNQDEYLKKNNTKFSKLVEYFIWGLYNIILGNDLNQQHLRAIGKYSLLYQLITNSNWITASTLLNLQRIMKLVYKDEIIPRPYSNHQITTHNNDYNNNNFHTYDNNNSNTYDNNNSNTYDNNNSNTYDNNNSNTYDDDNDDGDVEYIPIELDDGVERILV